MRGSGSATGVELRFVSPVRLVHRGELATRPELHVLVRALLRRIDMLLTLHGTGRWHVDFRSLIQVASQCRIESADLCWYDWGRQSHRQGRSMRLGGLLGSIRYRGPVANLLPLLSYGTATHVGKATTFGLGQYDLIILDDTA